MQKHSTGRLSGEAPRGFTLIELLVIIAIIGLLSAILFPVFYRARENARRSSCQSNLKQISLGIQQYVQDYDDRYPLAAEKACDPTCGPGEVQTNASLPGAIYKTAPAGSPGYYVNWMDHIHPYVKSVQIYACPSMRYTTDINYMYNPYVSGQVRIDAPWWNYYAPLSLAQIKRPTESFQLMDFNSPYNLFFKRPEFLDRMNNFPSETLIHFDGVNVAYLDGHVKWLGRTNSALISSDDRMWNPTLD